MKKLLLLLFVFVLASSCSTDYEHRWSNEFLFYNMDSPDTLKIADMLSYTSARTIPNGDDYSIVYSKYNDDETIITFTIKSKKSIDHASFSGYKSTNDSEEQPWYYTYLDGYSYATLEMPLSKFNRKGEYDGHHYFMLSHANYE